MQILKQIDDVDFGIIDGFDGNGVTIKPVHGDILIVKGAFEGDANAIATLGIVDGESSARLAFYKPIEEIEQMLNGRYK